MARKAREQSGTGVYHVMLRGINRQDIFEDDEDYRVFINILAGLDSRKSDDCDSVICTGEVFNPDEEVRCYLLSKSGAKSINSFLSLDKRMQKTFISETMRYYRVGPRQMSRITRICYGVIQRIPR